jgi:hypothetical protein
MAVNFYNGYVADDAATDASEVRVSVPNLTIADRIVYGPLPFRPNIGQDGGIRIPSRGDKCIIAVDDSSSGEQWIVSWVGSHISHQTTSTIIDLYDNRPVASSALNGVRFFASDKMMEWICSGGAWVLLNVLAPDVSILPSSPIDQQECQYVSDAARGIKWHLRYRAGSSSAYKWEFVGGTYLHVESINTGVLSNTGFTSYAAGGGGIAITVPLAGDYEIEIGCAAYATSSVDAMMSYTVGAAAALDADRALIGATSGYAQAGSRATVKTGIAAATAIAAAYRTGTAGVSTSFIDAWMRLRPVRVG